MSELNESVPPNPFYERGLAQKNDAPMVFEYRDALQEGIDEMISSEGQLPLRTKGGGAFDVVSVLGSNFEKLIFKLQRRGGGVSKAVGPAAVKVRHMTKDWRGDGYDDDVAERMQERSDLEHGRLKRLSASKHW
eukprot:1548546-Prymnesium_polylepis.1